MKVVQGRGLLQFRPSGRMLLATTAVVLAVTLAFALWVLGQLRAVFRTLGAGTPFVAANAIRIRRIGYAVILGELARAAIVCLGNYQVLSHFTAEHVRFNAWPDFSVTTIVHGLIILVIAEVFRLGARLDEEQSLTV